MTKKKDLIIVALVTFCLTAASFTVITTRSETPTGTYDPWVDINDDGAINILDAIILANHFATSGTPVAKTVLHYDSGWINITDKAGQFITVTHNLNVEDWNDPSIMVDITGKTKLDGRPLRFLGLTSQQGWNKTYGGTMGDSKAFSIVQTKDGGYALAGHTDLLGPGRSDWDFWLVKTDANGDELWNKTYGGTMGDEEAFSVVQTSDEGYALAGRTGSFGAGDDFWLVRTDANGNELWNKTYGGKGMEQPFSIVQTVDGGYALAGWTSSFAIEADFWLVKTDANGEELWNKTYGGTMSDEALSMVQTSDGGYALVGFTGSFGAGSGDFWLVKTDANGNELWNKTSGDTGYEQASSVVQTVDGGYALAGCTTSYGAGSYDFWLVKTDASGNAQWNKTYGGTSWDQAYALVQTVDGGLALAGYTDSFGAGNGDFWLVKTDANGDELWNKTYGGTELEEAFCMVQTSDKGYAIAGRVGSLGAGFWLVKTDANGDTPGIGVESGLAWVGCAANSITLYRGKEDASWNYVRVRILKLKD